MPRKKGAVYSVVALMLCVAVYLNWSYNKGNEYNSVSDFESGKILGEAQLVDGSELSQETSGSAVSDDYFSEARLSRQQARDEAVNILNATVDNQNTDKTAAAAASASIQVLAEAAVKESRIENMIKAKGYKDCVVFVNDNGINVIIAKLPEGLQDSDVAKITEIVISETGAEPGKIKILETA